MYELSKSMVRRLSDPMFVRAYFCGEGIDIGCGEDSLTSYGRMLPLVRVIYQFDKLISDDHDAQTMASVPDEVFDFVHSSHCLEHMADPALALHHWWRILKPGGHLIVLVPDEDLYEQGIWPSGWNDDHKCTLTIWKQQSWSPVSVNVIDLIKGLGSTVEIKYIKLLDAMQFTQITDLRDQTKTPNAESAIEFVLRKRNTAQVADEVIAPV